LIPKLKQQLCGKHFTEEILTAVRHKVAQISMSGDADGICNPPLCWQQAIFNLSSYFEADQQLV
jgi:hypothetical protein